MDVSELINRLTRILSGGSQARPGAGLIIRPHAVEGVVCPGKGRGTEVRYASAQVQGSDEAALTQAIRQVWTELRAPGTRAAVSVMSAETLVRFFTMPAMPKTEGETAAQFEVRKYIPFKLETLAWDVHLSAQAPRSDAPGSGGQAEARMDVVFAAMPREGLDRMLRALTAAGVDATRVEPSSMSVARLAVLAAKPDERGEVVCIVEIGSEHTHLVIVRDGTPQLTREFSLAGSTAGDTSEPADLKPLHRLVSELRVSMDFFARECPGYRVGKVILLSDQTGVQAWCETLATELHCRVQLGGLHVALGSGVPYAYSAALGAIAESKSGTPSLDFMKRAPSQAVQAAPKAMPKPSINVAAALAAFRNPQTIFAGVVSCVVPLLVCAGLGVHAIGQANQRLAQAKVTVTQGLNPQLAGMTQESLTPIRSNATKQLQFLRRLIDERTGVAARLDALARSLPDGVWITNFSFTDEFKPDGTSEPTLAVAGACYLGANGQEFGAIQAFQDRIRQHPTLFHGFVSAQVEQISAQTDQVRQATYRTFQLHCRAEQKM